MSAPKNLRKIDICIVTNQRIFCTNHNWGWAKTSSGPLQVGEPHIYSQATWSIDYITRAGPLVAVAAGAAAAAGAWSRG